MFSKKTALKKPFFVLGKNEGVEKFPYFRGGFKKRLIVGGSFPQNSQISLKEVMRNKKTEGGEHTMRDIKNADGRLVAKLDERSDTIVIKLKGYETRIVRKSDGTYEIVNTTPAA